MPKSFSFHSRKNFYLLNMRGRHFLSSAWGGGVMLVVFAVIALVLANNPFTKEIYHKVLATDVGISIGEYRLDLTVEQWINDALMAIFFFVVGLEIKRELIAGQLSSTKKAILPIAAALGGMAIPALIYALFNQGTEYSNGWGIPTATDIAFAIGILSLLGNKVPISLKVFLTALAIADDLGAIVVIALFYSSGINFYMLGASLLVIVLLYLMNHYGVFRTRYYIIPALLLWFLFLNSGIHATIAGVIIAMFLPSKPRFSKQYFSYKVRYFLEEFKFHDREGQEVLSNDNQYHDLTKVKYIASNTASLSQRLEHILNPIVTFFIIPVFALANAGVEIGSADELRIFSTTMGLGVFFGLVVGKPLGIFLMSWIMIKLKVAAMPENSTWATLFGVACLGGIGFTMSIFIDNLAFSDHLTIDKAKIAILAASIAASIIGGLILSVLAKKGPKIAKHKP